MKSSTANTNYKDVDFMSLCSRKILKAQEQDKFIHAQTNLFLHPPPSPPTGVRRN